MRGLLSGAVAPLCGSLEYCIKKFKETNAKAKANKCGDLLILGQQIRPE